jgi:hypothetical protein
VSAQTAARGPAGPFIERLPCKRRGPRGKLIRSATHANERGMPKALYVFRFKLREAIAQPTTSSFRSCFIGRRPERQVK